MSDPFTETSEDEDSGETNEIDPDNRNGSRGGAQVSHVSCQHQNGEDYDKPDPLSRPCQLVVRRGFTSLYLHAVFGLPLGH